MASTAYASIKKRKKPVIKKVPIALDGEKADEFNAQRSKVEKLREEAKDNPRDRVLQADLSAAEEKLESLRKDMKDDVVDFVFRSVGRQRYEDLLEDCQPTPKQIKEAADKGEEEPNWNPDTFPQALIAAAIVSPELTEEDIEDLWQSEDWNQAELTSLFMGALMANAERKVVDLGKGSGQIPS